VAFGLAYLTLTRILSWLALLARSAAKDVGPVRDIRQWGGRRTGPGSP
jgi:hypothetical protein